MKPQTLRARGGEKQANDPLRRKGKEAAVRTEEQASGEGRTEMARGRGAAALIFKRCSNGFRRSPWPS
jgi:hypothetical protein